MSKTYTVKLGDASFTLGKFNIDQVSRIAVLLQQVGPDVTLVDSVPKADARNSAVFIGLQTAGFEGTYKDFQALPDVRLAELGIAALTVGRAIGYYNDPDKETETGEGEGAQPASP